MAGLSFAALACGPEALALSPCAEGVLPCASLPLVDDFDRSDGPLGQNPPTTAAWVNAWDSPDDDRAFIQTTAITGDLTSDLAGAVSWGAPLPADAEVSFRVVSINGNYEDSNICMRAQAIDDMPSGRTYYCAFETGTAGGGPGRQDASDLDTIGLERREGNQPRYASTTLVASTSFGHEFGPGDVFGMRTVGRTISCYVREAGGIVHSIEYEDTSALAILQGGYAQVFIKANRNSQTGENERWDDFRADTITFEPTVPMGSTVLVTALLASALTATGGLRLRRRPQRRS